METETCRVCRSVNHAATPRCLNCGAPMALPPVPVGVAMDDLPAVPTTTAGGYGWSAAVPTSPAGRRYRSSSVSIVLGVVAVAAFIVGLMIVVSSDDPTSIPAAMFSVLFALWVVSGLFWLWMLFDAISSSHLGWAIAIFLFGVFGALGYALFGKSPRTAHY